MGLRDAGRIFRSASFVEPVEHGGMPSSGWTFTVVPDGCRVLGESQSGRYRIRGEARAAVSRRLSAELQSLPSGTVVDLAVSRIRRSHVMDPAVTFHAARGGRLHFHALDLLCAKGLDLTDRTPFHARHALLLQLIPPGSDIVVAPCHRTLVAAMEAASASGLRGVRFLARRDDSAYANTIEDRWLDVNHLVERLARVTFGRRRTTAGPPSPGEAGPPARDDE